LHEAPPKLDQSSITALVVITPTKGATNSLTVSF